MGALQFPTRTRRRMVGIIALIAMFAAATMMARPVSAAQDGPRVGQWTKGNKATVVSVASLMEAQAKIDASGVVKPLKAKLERELNWAKRNNPNSPAISKGGAGSDGNTPVRNVVQTVGTEFTGSTGGGAGADSGFVPPDTDGAAGPTQYIVGVNGRIRSFNKFTGVADGVIDLDTDTFYASVSSAGISDPLVKYDRLTQRWFITAIDVASSDNKVVIAVSDGPVISSFSSLRFFAFVQGIAAPTPGDTTCFFDYPTTGVDANALIIGGNQFCGAFQSYYGSDVYIVKKASILGFGPIELVAFRDLTTGTHGVVSGSATGITTARGIDSWDGSQNESYIIGDDNSLYGVLNFRRVTYPGGNPTISANITITVAQTSLPIPNQHLGNAGGGSANGLIDAIDSRIMPSYSEGGKLYATHGVSVNSTGVAQGATAGDRNAVRWYVFNNLGSTPAVEQFGTIYDSAASNPLSYTFGTMRNTGQGHIVYGFTSLGATQYPSAAYTGRLAGDTPGTTSTVAVYEPGVGAYNSFDTTFGRPRRWGDYSTMSLDPCDDQTVWAAQEFVAVGSATNGGARWGVRIAEVIAPPPAALASAAPASVAQGAFNVNVVITGTSSNGSGFFDTPNTNTDPCRTRLAATVSNGVTVNSVTYTSPTSITLNVTTFGATTGAATVTVTNPDGQSVSGAVLTITTGTPVETPTATSTASNTPTATATLTPSSTPTATNTPIAASCPGTLTNTSPTFNRPLAGNPPTGLSGVGTSVYYREMTFSVNSNGTYTIEMINPAFVGGDPDDGFYALYSPSFNPASPLTNVLQSDDDSGPGYQPVFSRALTAGTQYVLVSTTYGNGMTGTFTDVISGPGTANWCQFGGGTTTPTATATTSPTATPTGSATATNTPVPPRPDTVGVYNNGMWYLRNSNTTGSADITVAFGGDVADLPVVGDWNGDGVDTIGVYRNSTGFFFLSDSNTAPAVNYTVLFGNPGDTPFAGKWDNTMTGSGLGVYRNSNGILYQKKQLTTGFDDFFAIFGNPGDVGLAGDWNTDGFDSIGVYRSSNTTWYMTNNSTPSGIVFSDFDFVMDLLTYTPFVGDWDGDGDSTPGWLTASGVVVQYPGYSSTGGNTFNYGPTNSKPIAGKWIAPSRPPIGGVIPGNNNSGEFVNPDGGDQTD